jgi:dienelactone hydrolase
MRPCRCFHFKNVFVSFVLVLATFSPARGQSSASQVAPVLSEEILAPSVSLFQLREYILKRVAKPPAPADAQQWSAEARRLREHLVNDVVFHGWPKEWVNAPPRFEDLGVVETGKGYRIRKLRYEIVPGFQSVALLYEPEGAKGPIPAILNVNGHVGAPGKAVEYKQKRCINFAKQGMFALNLEWLACGELAQRENQHWFGAHLDLVGTHELGLFFLAMRRGLDYLCSHPLVDRNRIGMTGLSGGGWQTITLSSLDERVKAAVPVAGFSSLATRVEARRYGDLGDPEQSATDFLDGVDFTHLVGLMAPRPTLLVYNAEDDCCFRGPLVKPLVFDALKPLFKLYGDENLLGWHENQDPGTHNYQKDNRLQAYRFFSKHFKLPVHENEIDSDAEIKSYDELAVGLPKDNLTVLGLAQKLGREITRPSIPADATGRSSWAVAERAKLQNVVRYKPARVEHVWTLANTKNKGVETRSYQFELSNGMSANAVWVRGIDRPDSAPVTVVLNDQGKKVSAAAVSERVNRGEQVLALDLLFTGDAWRDIPVFSYAQILHGLGDRPLGMEAAQLIGITQWISGRTGVARVRLESSGMRTQIAGLVASALAPELFSEVIVREGIESLAYLLEKPVEFSQAPELFCLDLYRYFDLDRLQAMAKPMTSVSR